MMRALRAFLRHAGHVFPLLRRRSVARSQHRLRDSLPAFPRRAGRVFPLVRRRSVAGLEHPRCAL